KSGRNDLPLGEGAKREPDRAKPQEKVRVSGFGKTCDPYLSLRLHNRSRSSVQYTAVQAIIAEAGTTTSRRYHGRFPQYQPTSRNAAQITAGCPASAPKLKVTSAVTNSERGSPSSFKAPTKPIPCKRPKPKTTASRHGLSSHMKMFSTATYAIETAISASTMLGETETTP